MKDLGPFDDLFVWGRHYENLILGYTYWFNSVVGCRICTSTVLPCVFSIFVLYLNNPILCSTIFHRELLHIYLTALVADYFTDFYILNM